MKRWLYLVAVMACAIVVIVGIALAQVDKITIDNKYPNKLKGPVVLSHKAHADKLDCVKCHHTMKKEEGKTPQKCTACHKADDTGEKGLKTAYHKQCQNCHKDLQGQGKTTGPTVKCSECHLSKTK